MLKELPLYQPVDIWPVSFKSPLCLDVYKWTRLGGVCLQSVLNIIMTFFDTLTRSYADVDTSKGTDTMQFLEASEGLVKMFGKS